MAGFPAAAAAAATSGRPRKQWQLQDGPRGTLRRLRNQLAEDGCVESQVILAKCLLDEAEGGGAFENERAAVQWLIKACQRGNVEASLLLQQCLDSKRGLDENNYEDVLSCLNMSRDEVEARKAAWHLYSEASSDGNPITTGKLFQKLRRHRAGSDDQAARSVEKEGLSSCLPKGKSFSLKFLSEEGTMYTEEDLLNLASDIALGKDPKIQMQQTLETDYFSKLSFHDKVVVEPGLTLRMAYVQLLEWIYYWGNRAMRLACPPNWRHVLILFMVHSIMSLDAMLAMLPVAIFYAALFVLITATVSMLCFRQRLRDLRQWTSLFSLASKAFTKQRAEYLYAWQSFGPYLKFFVGLLILLFVYPLVPTLLIPASELTLLSLLLTATTFAALSDCHDKLILLSMGIQLFLQLVPRLIFSLRSWDYAGDTLPCAGVVLIGRHLRLHVGIPSILYLLVPLIFVSLATRNKCQGLYRVLIPHLVCITWWQLTLLFFSESSCRGLLSSSLFLAVFLFFIPLIGIGCFVLFAAIATVLVSHVLLWLPVGIFVFFLAGPYYLSKWLYPVQAEKERSTWFRIYRVASFVLAFLLIIGFYMSLSSHADNFPEEPTSIHWDDYCLACHKPSWANAMMVHVEMNCELLSGTKVVWDGTVEMVRLTSVVNKVERAFRYFPDHVGKHLRCVFGTPFEQRPQISRMVKGSLTDCDLSDWNVHTFEMTLDMKCDDDVAQVFVQADDKFRGFLMGLIPSDRVRVHGTLISGLGGPRPALSLDAIECMSCENEPPPVGNGNGSGSGNGTTIGLARCFQFVIHFFFSPLLEFSS